MQYPEAIRIALDFIEQNLKADITAEELAQMANYSTVFCMVMTLRVN